MTRKISRKQALTDAIQKAKDFLDNCFDCDDDSDLSELTFTATKIKDLVEKIRFENVYWLGSDDTFDSVQRCTRRALSEALGQGHQPRLIYEKGGGNMYYEIDDAQD